MYINVHLIIYIYNVYVCTHYISKRCFLAPPAGWCLPPVFQTCASVNAMKVIPGYPPQKPSYHGKPMKNLWQTYGKPMGKLWENYGKPMGNLWENL